MVLTYCKQFNKFIAKIKQKSKKAPLWKFKKKFFCKRKDHFRSSFAFRNKFYFWTQNVIFKKV